MHHGNYRLQSNIISFEISFVIHKLMKRWLHRILHKNTILKNRNAQQPEMILKRKKNSQSVSIRPPSKFFLLSLVNLFPQLFAVQVAEYEIAKRTVNRSKN